MSVEAPMGSRAPALRELEAEARYARERYQLYNARSFGSGLTSPSRLRELERMSKLAHRRLERAKAEQGGLAREAPRSHEAD
jgi:hypothetical protein